MAWGRVNPFPEGCPPACLAGKEHRPPGLGLSAMHGTGVLAEVSTHKLGRRPEQEGGEQGLGCAVPCTPLLYFIIKQWGKGRGLYFEAIPACLTGDGYCPLCSCNRACLCLLSEGY